MPALSKPSSYALPVLNFQPRLIDLDAPIDVEGAKAKAFAGIADTIGNLPLRLVQGYQAGKQMGVERQGMNLISDKLASPDLTGVAVDSTGKATYTGPRYPVDKTTREQGLYESISGQFPLSGSAPTSNKLSLPSGPVPARTTPTGPLAIAPDGSVVEGSVFGMVPDGEGGWMHDPNDVTDAGVPGFDPNKGAWGANIKDVSADFAALTPAELKKAGVNLDYGNRDDKGYVKSHRVAVTTPDGQRIILPIADKLGKGGRIDLSPNAYKTLGGPMNRGGGVIPGLKYEVVPFDQSQAEAGLPPSDPTKFPVAQPLPEGKLAMPPGLQQQIEQASKDAAQKLTSVPQEQLNLTAGPGGQPADLGAEPEIRRPTVGYNRSMGAAILAPSPDNVKAVFPGDKVVDITPKAETAKPEGVIFNTPKEAIDAGFDPTDAEVMPDGRLKVTKFKASGMDIKGRSKITDTMRKELGSAANLVMDMAGIEDAHKRLYSENKAGPIMGRVNEAMANLGVGAGDFVETNGTLKVSNFRIARLLNGPGVLTDKDIDRAQALAPTLKETPESFAAKMRSVRKSLKTDIQNWKLKNAETATPGLMQLADESLAALDAEGGAEPKGAPAPSGTPEVKTKAQAVLDKYRSGAYDSNPADKQRAETLLKQAGLL